MVTNIVVSNVSVCPHPDEDIVTEFPVKWCSVSLSDVLHKGNRLDANTYDVEAKQAWNQIHNGKYGVVSLYGPNGLIDHAYYPGWMQRSRLKRIWCEKKYGEGFYLPSQMTDIKPIAEKHISRLADCDLDELRLKKDTLLLTRSGSIGSVSYVSKTLDGKVFSDDVIRITFKEEYDLGYVYTFMKSKIGNKILLTNSYGAVITHIEPEHLAAVPIPDAPPILKQEIHQLIVRSYDLRDESNAMLDEAESLLREELRLPDIDAFDVNLYDKQADVDTFNVRLSDINGRLDASYHVPIVDAIVAHLEKHAAEVTTVVDERISKDVILPGRFKRIYVEEGYGCVFIGGKQISELDPSNKKYLSWTHHATRIGEQLALCEGMTLITRSGSVGKIAIVPKHWENWIASEHIIRVVPASDEIAGYLYIFLASEYAAPLIKRYTYGAVVDEIDDNHVREVPFPLLKNRETQTQINTLALQANEKRYEAYLLEQKALKLMEEKVIFA